MSPTLVVFAVANVGLLFVSPASVFYEAVFLLIFCAIACGIDKLFNRNI
jgi:hypothetical protein